MKRKITAAPVVDDAGRLCGAIKPAGFLPGRHYLTLQSQTLRQPVQVGDVHSSARAHAAQLRLFCSSARVII